MRQRLLAACRLPLVLQILREKKEATDEANFALKLLSRKDSQSGIC